MKMLNKMGSNDFLPHTKYSVKFFFAGNLINNLKVVLKMIIQEPKHALLAINN